MYDNSSTEYAFHVFNVRSNSIIRKKKKYIHMIQLYSFTVTKKAPSNRDLGKFGWAGATPCDRLFQELLPSDDAAKLPNIPQTG